MTKTFTERRALALGVAVSGVSIGTLVFPLIIRLLVHSFGWRGSLIICGALCSNICVCGMLLSRVPRYTASDSTVISPGTSKFSNRSLKTEKYQIQQLFTNSRFVVFSFTNLTVLLGLSVIYVHLSAFALLDLSLTEDEGAMLFSIMGIANFVGRILFGFAAQVFTHGESLLYGAAVSVSAILTMMLFKMKTFAILTCYVSLFGFFTACIGTLFAPILLRTLNNDHRLLPVGMAVILICDAIGTIIGSIVAGKLII